MRKSRTPRRGAIRGGVLAVLLLAACAAPPLTPAQQVYQLQLQFDAVLAELELYAAQPPCSPEVPVGCHDPEVLEAALTAFEEADRQLDLAAIAVREGAPTTTVTALANAARAALAVAARELAAGNAR